MKITIELDSLFSVFFQKLEAIHMQTTELATALNDVKNQVNKAKEEVVAKIAALEAALASTELPADAVAALDELKAAVQAVDDVVPDAPVI